MTLGIEVGLSPDNFVLNGDPSPPPLTGHSPQFLANVRCSQTAEWIMMPLGTEVNLGPGDVVLDGDPVPHQKGHSSPLFSAHVCCGHGGPSQLLLSSCSY